MLWSFLKIVLFVAAITAMTFGATALMETSGGILITLGRMEYSLSPLVSVVAALIVLMVIWIVFRLVALIVAFLRFLNGDETAISRYFSRNRERRGFQALADGLMALASGEGRVAMAKAAKAEKYLRRPALTNLISAQAAEMTGDRAKAEEVYKRLLTDDSTRFVGVRGILKQKLAEGDLDMALKLAKKAFMLRPRHEETQDALLRLQAQAGDWVGARKTLNAKLRHGLLPRDVHKRRDAVLILSEAMDVLARDNEIDVQEAAIEANRLSPDLIPAAAMAARGHIAQNRPRQAARVLKKAWTSQPHPDLAAAFAEIVPDETPFARLKRFRALTVLKPNDPETRMLLAELNIAAEDFPAARRAMGDLAEAHPTVRVFTLMAAIERGEGTQDSVVRGWLTRALTAPRGPQWVCDNCHAIHPQWKGACDSCHGLDTLSWAEPPASQTALPGSVGMLPLIVSDGGTDTAIEASPEAEQTMTQNGTTVADAETAIGGDDPASAPTGTGEENATTPRP